MSQSLTSVLILSSDQRRNLFCWQRKKQKEERMSTKEELLQLIKRRKAALAAIQPVPAGDASENWTEYQLAKTSLNEVYAKLADLMEQEETSTPDKKHDISGSTAGNFAIDSQIWLQSQFLVTHVSQLGKFNANNNSEVVNFLSKIKSSGFFRL